MRTQEWNEDQQILGPLLHARCLEERLPKTGAFHKGMRRFYAASLKPDAQPEAWIGHHCLCRMGQQRKIGRVIANVVERPRAETIAQAFQLFRSGKVGSAV